MVKRYRSGWWLELKYWDERLTKQEIAEECGVSPRTVYKYMEDAGIPRRDISGENHPMYGRERAEETKSKIAETMAGRNVSDETRERIAEARRGRELPAATKRRISESLTGVSRSEETRRKMSRSTAGERNPNWRGGYSNRYGAGWATARERVRDRDEVCRHCEHDGSERRLEVHHILSVRSFREADDAAVEDAHDEPNLVLCRRCHGRAERGLIAFESGIEPLEDPT